MEDFILDKDKLEEKLNPAKLLLKKVKLYGGLILLGCFFILIFI